jgi:ADP-ribosylglycohydrolase
MNESCGFEFLDLHPFVREAVLDKVRGTIFGGALGDAIGLYTGLLPDHEAEKALIIASRVSVQGPKRSGLSGWQVPAC